MFAQITAYSPHYFCKRRLHQNRLMVELSRNVSNFSEFLDTAHTDDQ